LTIRLRPLPLLKTILLVFMTMAMVVGNVATAHAQSGSCSRLQAALDQYNRSGDFRNYQGNSQAARDLARQVQNAESSYIRNGCNEDARAGRQLSRQCQGIAREVLSLRDQAAQAQNATQSGAAMAQQREAILQELARFGCGTGGSSATFSPDRQNLFDRIFGDSNDPNAQDGQMVQPDYWGGYGGGSTVRTLCVRLSDGYFWPVSYSTVTDYLGEDAQQCSQMCPGTETALYYHDNPGEEAEQMRTMAGERYVDLPTAFQYREVFDAEATCKTPSSQGNVRVVAGDYGDDRSVVEYGEATFPLPLRDPRGRSPIAVAALEDQTFVSVPLPRRRPAGPGEAPQAEAVASEDPGLRLVQFGEKVVRVVGPDTPYAQPRGEGT
jgi:hypothetical protein